VTKLSDGITSQHRPLQRRDRLLTGLAVISVAVGSVVMLPRADSQVNRTQRLVEQALALVPQRDRGARLYAERCASCHGKDATGDAETVTPSLAGQIDGYLIRELVDMAESNRPVSEMHRLLARPELTSAQAIRDVTSHVASLPRLAKPQVGNGQALPLGQRVYETICLQCHGPEAQGDRAALVPALQGQHYSYLLMQTRQMPVSHGYDIGVETLERFEDLTLEELAAVSDYISRIKVDQRGDLIVQAD